MSIWTHVVGCIRVDGLPQQGFRKEAVERILGPMSLFKAWRDDSTLPGGSEGTLQYRVIEYDAGLPWIAIPVWGDLRDYDDVEEIKKWWSETLAKLKLIRDAVLHIQVEGQEPVILTAPKEMSE